MGIFNEHSHNNQFARGLQGAPGVGFHLTSEGDYDMVGKKLTNVGAPIFNTDAATKKYVDNNNSSFPTVLCTNLVVDSNIDMKDKYYIKYLTTPVDADDAATKQYADTRFLNKDGSHAMTGHLYMGNNKIENLIAPTSDSDTSTKNYVDTNISLCLRKEGSVPLTGNLNMNNKKITSLKTPTANTEASTKKYVDDTVAANKVDGSVFLKLDGSQKMTGNLDMNSKQIYNLPSPQYINQPTTLAFTDLKYLARDGSPTMTNHLNMDNKKIINLTTPTNNNDAANKKYVDDKLAINGGALGNYLKKDGTTPLTGKLNLKSNKIIHLSTPTSDTDATNKEYVDKLNHESNIQPSHYDDQFSYLMSSSNQWTDEIDGGNSFNITRIGDLPPNKGNFHDYKHKVLYMTICKNSQGGYKYKMGFNFYRLTANADYTLCLELLNTDYQLCHKSQISVDKGTSTGLSIENVGVRKLSHRYTTSSNKVEFMYYHRIIVNFRKLNSGNKFFLHILVNIPQAGTDLAIYPRQFSGVYMIAYGII